MTSSVNVVQESRDDGQVTIGRHSYYHGNPFEIFTSADRIEVGSFCSIAGETRILGGGEHAMDLPSTFPLRTLLTRAEGGNWDACSKGPTCIGNDVWIGYRALILSGVTIGHGAVVGAGAVVARDVPPYTIVTGNPANVVGHRFDESTIERLLALRWWDWPDERIFQLDGYFYSDVGLFLDVAEMPPAESDVDAHTCAAVVSMSSPSVP